MAECWYPDSTRKKLYQLYIVSYIKFEVIFLLSSHFLTLVALFLFLAGGLGALGESCDESPAPRNVRPSAGERTDLSVESGVDSEMGGGCGGVLCL